MLSRWTLTSTLLFTHLQFMSSHDPHPASWPILTCREGEMDLKEEQKEKEPLGECTYSTWPSHGVHQQDTVFDRFLTPLKNMFWTDLRRADDYSKRRGNDAINCASLSLLIHIRWKLWKKQGLGWYIFVTYNIVCFTLLFTSHIWMYFSNHTLSLTSD